MGANDKAAAALHPQPVYECAWCGKTYDSRDAASSCCGDWLSMSED